MGLGTDPEPWFHKSYYLDWVIVLLLHIYITVGHTWITQKELTVIWDNHHILQKEQDQAVPSMFNYLISLLFALFPILVAAGVTRRFHDLHHGILGMLESSAIGHTWSIMLKNISGVLRPDFVDRCHPIPTDAAGNPIDLQGVNPVQYLINLQKDYATFWDAQNFVCSHGDKTEDQARKSFPAGHGITATVFGAYAFLYILGRLRAFDGQHHFAKFVAAWIPLTYSACICATRVGEGGHGYWDAIIGFIIGCIAASVGYNYNYHSMFDRDRASRPRNRLLAMKSAYDEDSAKI